MTDKKKYYIYFDITGKGDFQLPNGIGVAYKGLTSDEEAENWRFDMDEYRSTVCFLTESEAMGYKMNLTAGTALNNKELEELENGGNQLRSPNFTSLVSYFEYEGIFLEKVTKGFTFSSKSISVFMGVKKLTIINTGGQIEIPYRAVSYVTLYSSEISISMRNESLIYFSF